MLKPFLTANWRYLTMLNFIVAASAFIAEGSQVEVLRRTRELEEL
jgi:hypothetical protein